MSPPYPRPKVPMLPVLSISSVLGATSKKETSFFSNQKATFVNSGRLAIKLGLEHLNLAAGDKVLVPSYHCTSMIDPIRLLSLVPVNYKLNPDLSPNLDDIKQKLDDKSKALLVPHYFGFPQPIENIRKFCDANKLFLIEDCAHAIYGSSNNKLFGSFGDIAIASIKKFFPVTDGGCIVSNNHELQINIAPPSTLENLKALINTLEQSTKYGRLMLLRPIFGLYNYLRKSVSAKKTADPAYINTSSMDLISVIPDKAMTNTAKIIVKFTNKTKVLSKRRSNFALYLNRFKQVSNTVLPFDELPDDVVPYVFPIVVKNHEFTFPKAKTDGVPIWRWDSLPKGSCEVSNYYRYSLFQLPCHQELSTSEINWIADTLIKYLTSHDADQTKT